jgi:hypothetical protein
MAMNTIAENLVQYHVFSASEGNLSVDASGMVEVKEEEKETKQKRFCCSIS